MVGLGTIITKQPIKLLSRSILSAGISKTILLSATKYMENPDTNVELEGLTVEAVGKKTPAEVAALLSGAIFVSSIVYGYKRLAIRDSLIIMSMIQKVINLKSASLLEASTIRAQLMMDMNAGVMSVFDANAALMQLDDVKEEMQIIEGLLKMGSDTNDLRRGKIFSDTVEAGGYLTPTILDSISNLKNADGSQFINLDEYTKALANIVDSHKYFSQTDELEMLRSTIFEVDDILGYRKILTAQIDTVDNFITGWSADIIVEQSKLPRYDFEDMSDEGKFLNKQEKMAMAQLDEVKIAADKLDGAFTKYLVQEGVDITTGQINWARRVSTGTGRLLGKAFYYDGILWIGTTVIDIGLNAFLPEDEQGFFSDRVGFSFVDEFLLLPLIDWAFGSEEVRELILDKIVSLVESSETLTAVIYSVLLYFVEEFNVTISFNVDREDTGKYFADLIEGFEPEYILVAGFIAITVTQVWKYLLLPSWKIITG